MELTTARPRLLAISHGTGSVAGRTAVGALVAAVRARHGDVRGGFVDVLQPDVATVLARLELDRRGVIVPLLLSAGYHVHVDLRRAVRDRKDAVRIARALGPDAALVEVLRARLEQAGLEGGDRVVLAAAGSSDARAVDDCRVVGEALAARLGREVTVGFLSAAEPRLPAAVGAARDGGGRVVVASYLLAPGYFQDRAAQAGAEVVTDPLLVAHETPAPGLVDLVLRRYAEAAARFDEAA
ncbi:sirohydrochlorin chelatase [Amnibacterium endophyticum]|uniref:Sirohydrochlorin chelatase n=1 Tax=Amnibacterium endophyticum TaxID=2109337 RepID=A0ABW4LGU1_9MICO